MRNLTPDRQGCGHDRHEMVRIQVSLGGRPRVSEYPAIPDRWSRILKMDVYRRDQYLDVEGRCWGKDIVSQALQRQGCWEGFETLVTLAILNRRETNPGLVLDVGAHLGWYTLLAATSGHRVVAYDTNEESLVVLRSNARLNHVGRLVETRLEWIDEQWQAPDEQVLLLKSDVEGSENHVVAGASALLAAGRVDYLLLEISPCFRDHYPDTVGRVMDAGYEAFEIPAKRGSGRTREEFESDVFAALRARKVPRSDVAKRIGQRHQANWLFARQGLIGAFAP